MYDPTQQLSIRRYVINDPSVVQQHGEPTEIELADGATWSSTHPGTYTLVVEVRRPGQLPTYYTVQQRVLAPYEMAQYYLSGAPVAASTGLYLQSLELQIQRLEQQVAGEPEDFAWSPADDKRKQIEQLRAILENARAKLDSEPPPIPLQAVLVASASSEIVPLQLYAKPTADGGWAITDLTNPDPGAVREYREQTLEAAWERFLVDNRLPEGQIAARPTVPSDPGYQGVPNLPSDFARLSWNAHNDGKTTLQKWKDALIAISLIAGVAAIFVPGGQIPAVLALAVLSAGTGAAAAGLSTLDRAKYGNLRWNTDTALDLLELGGSLAPGVKLVAQGRRLSVRQLERATVISEVTDRGVDVGTTLLLSSKTTAEIQAIENDDSLTEQQKRVEKEQVLRQALQEGQAMLLGRLTDELGGALEAGSPPGAG